MTADSSTRSTSPAADAGLRVAAPARARRRTILPGFGLTLAFTLAYLSLIVLIPLSATFVKASTLGWAQFWRVVTEPRSLASYRLSFGASFLGAAVNAVFGLVVAWVLVRYRFPGRRLLDEPGC